MRNKGLGKTLVHAGRCIIDAVYGDGKYGTKRQNKTNWRQIAAFLKSLHIRDLSEVTFEVREQHAAYLAAGLANGDVAIPTAHGHISTFNIVMAHFNGDDSLQLSASKYVGKRCTIRKDIPPGYDVDAVENAAAALKERGFEIFGAFSEISRETGMRLREVVSQDYRRLAASINSQGEVQIVEGSKGGTARHVERRVPVSDHIYSMIESLAYAQGSHKSLIPEDLTRLQFLKALKYQWYVIRDQFGLARFRDLRAAAACDWYFQITGCLAPVFKQGRADREADQYARDIISPRLGHRRRGIATYYVGGTRT